MTPARRKTLSDAVDLIASINRAGEWASDAEPTRQALIRIGAAFVDGATNTMNLAGVSARCTFDTGEHLLLRWAANARTALAQGTDASASTEEEE